MKTITRQNFDLVSALTAYEQGDLDHESTITLFQYLVNTGLAWNLQGSYGRTAARMIANGEIIHRSSVGPAEDRHDVR